MLFDLGMTHQKLLLSDQLDLSVEETEQTEIGKKEGLEGLTVVS